MNEKFSVMVGNVGYYKQSQRQTSRHESVTKRGVVLWLRVASEAASSFPWYIHMGSQRDEKAIANWAMHQLRACHW